MLTKGLLRYKVNWAKEVNLQLQFRHKRLTARVNIRTISKNIHKNILSIFSIVEGKPLKRLIIFGFSSLTPRLIAVLMILRNLFLTVLPVPL